jgi:accessory gene regulator protein AgrB
MFGMNVLFSSSTLFALKIPPSVTQSLSFIFKSETRFVHNNQHSSKSIANTILSLSLYIFISRMQNKIETL